MIDEGHMGEAFIRMFGMVGVYGKGLARLHRQATHEDFGDGCLFNWILYL